MAKADYRLCDMCAEKAFYDAKLSYEEGPSVEAGIKGTQSHAETPDAAVRQPLTFGAVSRMGRDSALSASSGAETQSHAKRAIEPATSEKLSHAETPAERAAPASSGASEPAEAERQPLTDDEVTRLLPPLPEPSQGLGSHRWAYSSDDMRAYGQSCADKVKRAIAHLRSCRRMQ